MTKTPKPKTRSGKPKPPVAKCWWGRSCRRSYYKVCERPNETAQVGRKRKLTPGAKRKTGKIRRAKG
jgi:hypothetical protein